MTQFFQLPAEERAQYFTTDHSKPIKLFNYYLKLEGDQHQKVTMWSETFSHLWEPLNSLPEILPNTVRFLLNVKRRLVHWWKGFWDWYPKGLAQRRTAYRRNWVRILLKKHKETTIHHVLTLTSHLDYLSILISMHSQYLGKQREWLAFKYWSKMRNALLLILSQVPLLSI